MARDSAPPAPSRSEVDGWIRDLIDRVRTRDEVASWAMQWVNARDPGVDDERVWSVLNDLAGVDTPSTDRRFLYEQADFEAWREELRTE